MDASIYGECMQADQCETMVRVMSLPYLGRLDDVPTRTT